MMNVEKFFEDVFGRDPINFSCIHGKTVHQFNGAYNANTISLLNQFNSQGYECYFVVNKGGYKDSQITAFTSVFADFDCGRDENKHYFPMGRVAEYKQEKLQQLRQFALKPTYINETRNGLHVYWLLHEGATLSQFQECEDRLIRYFGADKGVKNPCRLLRVPNTYWCKDNNNRHLTTILENNEVRYNIAEILDELPVVEFSKAIQCDGIGDTDRKKSTSLLPIMGMNTQTQHSNVPLICNQQVDVLQALLKPQEFVAANSTEVFTYLKQNVSLHEYLGVDGDRFCCVFHNDTHPSAGIFRADSGDWMYKCHSASCGITGTIIELTKHMLNTQDLGKTMRFLRRVYQISFAPSEWKQSQEALYHSNIAFLESKEFEQGYQAVYNRIRTYLPVLVSMNKLAKEHIETEQFTDSKGRPVFFASLGHIAKVSGRNATQLKSMTNIVALFAYLGLTHKLPVEEIPAPLLKSAKHEAAKKKQSKLVSFYSIPPYDQRTLDFASTKTQEFKNMGLTIGSWGWEVLRRSYGEDEANRVYPQEQGRALSELSDKVTQKIEVLAMEMISLKGWTTEQEILSMLELRFKGQARFKQEQIKRSLPDMLNKYCLIRTRLNKQLKQDLGIEVKGYPFVILKENEHERTERKRTRTEASRTVVHRESNKELG